MNPAVERAAARVGEQVPVKYRAKGVEVITGDGVVAGETTIFDLHGAP